jgi:hypothetical protein
MDQMVNRKVTVERIVVHNNGEKSGKGEFYWSFSANGKLIEQNKKNPMKKVEDGDTIDLGDSVIVNGLQGSNTLTVSGSVSERDGLSKNETDFFERTYSRGDNWGIGSYHARLQDHPLDVTVYYKIENA